VGWVCRVVLNQVGYTIVAVFLFFIDLCVFVHGVVGFVVLVIVVWVVAIK